MSLLQTRNLTIGYPSGAVISDINIALNEGELVCLLGANGRGKSTLLRTLAGVQQPLSGSIEMWSKELRTISKHKLAKILGLVYTDLTQAGGLTVEELVELGRQPHTGFFGRLNADDHSIVEEAMESTGIINKRKTFVADLSDGERQKAMIAKALAQETPMIFLDEPTAFLDIASKIETIQLLHELSKKQKKTILMSSHDVSNAIVLADKLMIINKDGYLKIGVTEDLIFEGELDNLFDGSNIEFDRNSGQFKTKGRYNSQITVVGENSEYCFWLENALRRVGFEPVKSGAKLTVIINSPTEIKIGEEKCASIGELMTSVTHYLDI